MVRFAATCIGTFIFTNLVTLASTDELRRGAPAPRGWDQFSRRLLELTNIERARAGAQPLTQSPMLDSAAAWMARDMADGNYVDHLDRKGRRVGSRAYDHGYRAWKYIAENIAAGQSDPDEVFQGWMASPGHRRNILRPEFTEMGVGIASNPSSAYGKYWVQTFGSRPAYVSRRTP